MTTKLLIDRELLERALPYLSNTPDLVQLGAEELADELRAALAAPVHGETVELWAVHAQGSDDIYPAFSKEDAEKHASELNALPMPEGIAVGAVVVHSPWPAAKHWEYLAEEERDHKEQIMALAAQQPKPAAVQEGYVLVPVEPTPEMVSAADEAHMPFGDMDIALRMAILSAPSAPATRQGDGWIPVSERLPQIKQVLSEKCTLEGREIPTLYRSGMVLTFDGSRVSAGIVEWFHSKSPLNNVTHWMPLPAAPEVV